MDYVRVLHEHSLAFGGFQMLGGILQMPKMPRDIEWIPGPMHESELYWAEASRAGHSKALPK